MQNKETAIIADAVAQLDKGNNKVDTSGFHAIIPISPLPSPTTAAPAFVTSSPSANNDDDFAAQAALSLTRAAQTNNLVNTRSYYDIMFRTTTTGIIKTVEMNFPASTYVGSALLVEATGIGPGKITADNVEDIITYTVTNAVNVPANTKIRIQLANINNPSFSAAFTVTITTRDSATTIIDGPTATGAYNIKQIGTNDIADNAVTTSKIATGTVTSEDIADGAVTEAKINQNEINVVWHDNTPGNFEIFHRSNGIIDFQPPTGDLSNNAADSFNPAIAASGNNVYVVWIDNTSGNSEILYRRSTDGGATFGSTVNLSNNAGASRFPDIAAVNNS